MTLDFSKYLGVKAENIEAAKPLPGGHYHAKIISWKGAERDYKNGEPVVPVCEITCRTTAPDDDVEVEDLPASGGVGVLLTVDYRLVAPNSNGKVEGGGQGALRALGENIGIDTRGLDLTDILDAMREQDVLVFCDPPREDKRNAGIYYTNPRKILPVSS